MALYAVGGILLDTLLPLEERVTANQVVLSDQLYPMMKHSSSTRSGLFQDPPIHRARGIIECFDEYENDVNYMLWPSDSPNINPVKQFWTIM